MRETVEPWFAGKA